MKFPKVLPTLLGVVLSASFAMAQSTFEGVITYKTTNSEVKENASVTWYHKNGQNLMEFESHAGEYNLQYAMIMGTNDETVYMTTDKGSQEISGITADERIAGASFVRKSTTTENGYNCEMLMFKANGYDLVYWVTSDVALSYSQLPKLMKNNMPDLKGISNGFPIKMEMRDAKGNIVMSQDVVSIETIPVSDSKFKRN